MVLNRTFDAFQPSALKARVIPTEVSVLVTDERELELADSGLLMLEDAESGQQRLIDTASAGFRAQLKEQAAARIKGLESELRSSGIDLVRVDATRPVVDPLLRFFRMRERRRRR